MCSVVGVVVNPPVKLPILPTKGRNVFMGNKKRGERRKEGEKREGLEVV